MTAEPPIPFPISPYCQVRARVASIWADGPDDGTNPDWRPAVGEKVTLTPSIASQVLTYDAAGDNPIIVTVERVNCEVSADGWLTKSDGRPVYIAPTDDPLLSVTGWTWTASIKGRSITFAAPTSGVVDLADFITAPATDDTKVWVERLPELVALAADAETAADRAEAAADLTRETSIDIGTVTTVAAGSPASASIDGEAPDFLLNLGLTQGDKGDLPIVISPTPPADTDVIWINPDEPGTTNEWTIIGEGRPDIPATLTTPGTASLVAAAQSGAEFRSTDGPQGAWVWRKRGTTWVCVEGDTGDVNFASLLDPNFTASGFIGAHATAARDGNLVTLSLHIQVAEGAEIIGATRAITRTIGTLPAGLDRPGLSAEPTLTPVAINNVYDGPRLVRSSNLIRIANARGTWAAGDSIRFTTTLRGSGPWPTTLTL